MNEDADPTFHLNLLSQHLNSSPLKIPMENYSMIHFLGGQVANFWQKLEAKIFDKLFFNFTTTLGFASRIFSSCMPVPRFTTKQGASLPCR